MEPGLPSPHIDTSRPHPARMYDYYLGGCFP
ncbi:MAG: SAM-dependent methyltransferase [Streptosporangiaceae bacterium]